MATELRVDPKLMPAVDDATFAHLASWLRYRQIAITQAPDVDVLVVWDTVLAELSVSQVRRRELVVELALVYRQITTRKIDVWPGTFEMLDACRGFCLAIASNTQRAYTEPELRMFGLWDYFERVILSSDVKACKPDIAIFQGAQIG